MAVHQGIYALYENDPLNAGHNVAFGRAIPGTLGRAFPDILDSTSRQIGEIKPLSLYGLTTGPIQLAAYLAIANGFTVNYNGIIFTLPPLLGGGWTASNWAVGVRPILPGMYNPAYGNWIAFTLGNVGGLILYKAFRVQFTFAPVAAVVLAARIADVLAAALAGMQLTTDNLPVVEFVVDHIVEIMTGVAIGSGLAFVGMNWNRAYGSLVQSWASLTSLLAALAPI